MKKGENFNVTMTSKTTDLSFMHKRYTEWGDKQKKSSEWQFCWQHHLVDEGSQKTMVLTNSKATVTLTAFNFHDKQKSISECTTPQNHITEATSLLSARNKNLRLQCSTGLLKQGSLKLGKCLLVF